MIIPEFVLTAIVFVSINISITATPTSPTTIRAVPILSKNFRPRLSTSATAKIVTKKLTNLIPKSPQLAASP